MKKVEHISYEQIRYLKPACKTLYLESRKFKGDIKQQDEYLEYLVEEFFKESYIKVIKEDSDINRDNISQAEEYGKEFLCELKSLMKKWQKEFERELSGKKWWMFWK